ncbi:MAG: ABC transporter permease [Acidobacteria bacterium]|nr:ABC transporter permease [Acidobacteriota bacterium]
MQGIGEDLRYALRLALRRPALTAVTILMLAIGVGSNTAIFSLVNAALLRPLPVPNSERLVRLFGATDVRAFDVISYPNAVDFVSRSRTLHSLAIHQQTFVASGLGDATETAAIELVSGNYFSTFGVPAALGRVIQPDDDQLNAGQPVAVISDRWWRTRFGASPAVLGSPVYLNGAAFSVIGVAPAAFRGSYDALGTDMWVPLMTYGTVRPRGLDITNRGWGWLYSTGRLREGVAIEQARAELAGIASALRREHASQNDNLKVSLVRALAIPEDMAPMLQRVLIFALIVAGLALAGACANIANVQLAGVIGRRREIAIRQAMGATRARVMRQWIAESILLACTAAAVGLLLAVWTQDAILMLRPPVPGLQNLDPNVVFDWRVLSFAAALAMLTTVLFGGLPAYRATCFEVTAPLKEDGVTSIGGRRRSLAQRILLVTQVAVSLALLVSAGLLVRSIAAVGAFPLGFNASNLVIAEAEPGGLNYNAARRRVYYRETMERVRALPGVSAVTFGAVVPLGDARESRGVAIEGYTPPDGKRFISIATNLVATNYFDVMSIPIVGGRGFAPGDGDDEAAVVAVVNETMARRYWRDGDPIGRQIQLGNAPPVQVVGVAKDIPYYAVGEPPRPYLYLPFGPITMDTLAFHVRATGNVGLAQALRRELRATDSRIRVPVVMGYEELRQIPLYPSRVMATVSSAFGVMTLLLTLVGLYGVVVYSVSQRTREFAVRMALGARPGDILRGVLRGAVGMTAVGVVIGVAVAAMLARLLRGFLFGVSTFDPVTFGSCAAILVVIALTAAYVPARRATRIDSAAALTGRVG